MDLGQHNRHSNVALTLYRETIFQGVNAVLICSRKDRWTDRQADRQTKGKTDMQEDKKIDGQTEHMDIHMDREKGMGAGEQTDSRMSKTGHDRKDQTNNR